MINTAHQLFGIIRTEFRRSWRRRGLPMMLLIWLIAVVWGTTLFSGPTFFQPSPELIAKSATVRKAGVTLDILIAGGGISTVFAVFTLSILAAEGIPIDRELGVLEWYRALPVSGGVYLLGKLLGLWTAVFSGMAGIAFISGIAFALLIGPFDLPAFLRLWLVALTGIALYISGLSLLATSWLRSRRWAVFVAMGLAIVGYLVLIPGFLQFLGDVYLDYFMTTVSQMTAEACRIDPEICGQPLIRPDLFPELLSAPRTWLWRLLGVWVGTAVFSWAWHKKEGFL